MIKNIFFVAFFLLMALRPDIFNKAQDEKTRAVVTKVMRIGGIIGLVCIFVIIVMQLIGVV